MDHVLFVVGLFISDFDSLFTRWWYARGVGEVLLLQSLQRKYQCETMRMVAGSHVNQKIQPKDASAQRYVPL